ncbi:unnamed protein product [Ectocarpus fasciculatus]
MAICSFLLCHRRLKNVFPSQYIRSISLPAFSTHFLCPSTAPFSPGYRMPQSVSRCIPTNFPSSVMYTSLLVQRTFRNYMDPVLALRVNLSSSSSTFLNPRLRSRKPMPPFLKLTSSFAGLFHEDTYFFFQHSAQIHI